METRLSALSFGLAVAAAIFLLVWPVYSGLNNQQPFRATLLEVNGAWAVLPVMFPVLIAFLPVLFHRQAVRIAAAILMGGFSLIALMSIGIFYLPAAITIVVAACIVDKAKAREYSS
jgi:hypothetical protein